MFQSGPWIFGLWIFAPRIFAPRVFAPWIPAILVGMGAGVLDWRYRRIPNWLTVSGLVAGVAVNTFLYHWPGLKAALLGTALGLGLLLPFVLARSLGAGDWKLAGALGACLGPRQLLAVLMGTILVAGVMALAVVIWEGRLKRTLLNIAHLLAALFSLRMPGSEVSLDDPQSTKIPFGVAMAVTVLFYGMGKAIWNL
ncbi:MAG: A24 family peptidase [Terriglobales bacterium]|jgi:prepilin peptidase CpaA